MAGTDAGKSFNTFPFMNEQFIPEGYYLIEYGWKNMFENTIMFEIPPARPTDRQKVM